MIRVSGWSGLDASVRRDVTGIYRDAARLMFDSLADTDNSSLDSGAPLASGHYAASMRIGLNASDTSVAPIDSSYNYPSPAQHHYSRWNLPAPTIGPVASSTITNWLRPFKLGDIVYLSNSSAYAIVIENGRRGKNGSWQKPRGVFLPTLTKLFQQQGWM